MVGFLFFTLSIFASENRWRVPGSSLNIIKLVKMEEKIIEQLNRIERNSLLAAKNVLNMDDAVLITGLSRSYLYSLTSKAEIPHYKQANKVYFDRAELEAWLKENRIATSSEIETAANAYMVSTTGTNGHRKGGRK